MNAVDFDAYQWLAIIKLYNIYKESSSKLLLTETCLRYDYKDEVAAAIEDDGDK